MAHLALHHVSDVTSISDLSSRQSGGLGGTGARAQPQERPGASSRHLSGCLQCKGTGRGGHDGSGTLRAPTHVGHDVGPYLRGGEGVKLLYLYMDSLHCFPHHSLAVLNGCPRPSVAAVACPSSLRCSVAACFAASCATHDETKWWVQSASRGSWSIESCLRRSAVTGWRYLESRTARPSCRAGTRQIETTVLRPSELPTCATTAATTCSFLPPARVGEQALVESSGPL